MEQQESEPKDLGLKIRTDILEYSLKIEEAANVHLALLLGINDIGGSKSFSNKSSSLSFNQKVNLLLDIGALKKDDVTKFISFMEIRNQFMHNAKALSYIECLSYIDGKDKYLLKYYPQDESLPIEEKLKLAVFELAEEVLNKTYALVERIKENIKNDVNSKMNELLVESFKYAADNIAVAFNENFKDKKTSENEPLDKLGDTIRKIFRGIFGRKFKELTDETERTTKWTDIKF